MNESAMPPITVKVSPVLLAELEEWSEPVQVRIVQAAPDEYTMEARPCS